jgi:lipopolysaccharide/colanic/teichoic acid biosynthesis glycosyltransferase
MSSPATEMTTRPWPQIDWLSPDVKVDLTPANGWYAAMKPALDFALAVVLLVPALPLIGLCWLLTKLTSPGPGFYTQTRSGQDGRSYKIIKIRTMHNNIESRTGIQWSQKGDCRVTRLGAFLRATHLDELPQLFNVLRGEMGLVGPRPERPEVIRTKGLGDLVPGYDRRLDVRPGVTGLAQVQLPADSDIASVRHKVVYDLYYIANRSLWLDLRICGATLMKAAGMGPAWLRTLFFLPDRDEVAALFHRTLTIPATEPHSSAEFQAV